MLFDFTKSTIEQDFRNPYDNPTLGKTFKAKAATSGDILEKAVIDEIIFKTENLNNRLMLQVMARGGMRVGSEL